MSVPSGHRPCLFIGRRRDANLQVLIDRGHGDVPLARRRWRCCCGTRIDMVVMSKDAVAARNAHLSGSNRVSPKFGRLSPSPLGLHLIAIFA